MYIILLFLLVSNNRTHGGTTVYQCIHGGFNVEFKCYFETYRYRPMETPHCQDVSDGELLG